MRPAPLPIAKLMASLQSHMASNPNAIAQAATVVALMVRRIVCRNVCGI